VPIRILPEAVVRRIRAGEVIERPASAVKELVENAIDAGATRVTVRLDGAGTGQIVVEDDGEGMAPEDLVLAPLRHATSKLGDDADPATSGTLGFRGEALAAMSAVANLRIVSRTAAGDHAWALEASADGCSEPRPAARARGTTVEASGLFSGHPARAAFLKSPRREVAAVREAVEALALARPDTRFSLVSDGSPLLDLAPGRWEDRARSVMGTAFAENSVSFSAHGECGTVRGLASLPAWPGHARGGQRFLVNGRVVRDRTLASALRAAYADLSGEQSPSAFVDLRVDPARADVNVHPAKAEVRLRDPEAVHVLVKGAVRSALAGEGPSCAPALAAMATRAARPADLSGAADGRALRLGRPLGVVMGGYAVCEAGDRMLLVDLHAACERAAYERLRADLARGPVAVRVLPRPIVVEVGHPAAAAVSEREDALASLGLLVGALDGGTVAVRGIPAILGDTDAASLVARVAAGLAADPCSDPLGEASDRTCATLACHAAWRFGDGASIAELDAMLRDIESTPMIGTCMHGRPTVIEIGATAMASMFGRR
jgi:DNA mismatch repair protein MutL